MSGVGAPVYSTFGIQLWEAGAWHGQGRILVVGEAVGGGEGGRGVHLTGCRSLDKSEM